ncbi:MAG: hypothetical protein RL557_834 [archaeon]|jgi:amidophosphoribosyltransferase
MGEVDSKCGFFIAHSLHDVYQGLEALQHRGEDATGIFALTDRGEINGVRWVGKVGNLNRTTAERILEGGIFYVGEVRYGTCGEKSPEKLLEGALPRHINGRITADYQLPYFPHRIIRGATHALAHNGNLIGVKPRGNDTDSDVMLRFYALQETGGVEKIIETFPAAYSAAILDARKDYVCVFKDRYAIRPLWIGEKDGRLVASSEDRAITEVGGNPLREFRPGEIIDIPRNGTHFNGRQILSREKRPCFFERNYLGDVLSSYQGMLNRDTRRRLGVELAEEFAPDVDIVSFIPNAPRDHARAYSDFRKIPFAEVFYKIKSERAFLGPDEKSRLTSIDYNLYTFDHIDINGKQLQLSDVKRLLLIDDSIVRLNNLPIAVKKLRDKGVGWIGVAVGTPGIGPVINGVNHGCYYGVDIPPDDNFAVRNYSSVEEMVHAAGVDALHFISKRGLENALRRKLRECCAHCIGEPNPVLDEELIRLDSVVDEMYGALEKKK